MKLKSVLSLAICMLECMLMGGAIFGWGPILYTFEQDDIYSEQCTNKNVTTGNKTELEEDCSERSSTFNLAFTLGIAMMGIASFPVGVLFDHVGLLPTRIFLSVISVLGLLSWGFASPDLSWLVFVGCILNGATAITILTTNCHAAELAGSKTGVFIGMFNGGANSIGFWFTLVLILHDKGFSRKWSLLILAALWIVGTINTLLLLPKFKVGQEKPQKNKVEKTKESQLMEKDGISAQGTTKTKTLKECLCSLLYISHVSWFCLLHMRNNVFLGTMVPWLSELFPDDDDKVGDFTSVFGFMTLGCVGTAPLSGFISDFFKKKYQAPEDSDFWVKARAGQYSLLITSCFAIGLSIANIFEVEATVYLTFVLEIFFLPALYGTAIAFIPLVFPIVHFGKLLGIMMLVGSGVQFLQVPLLMWAENDNFTEMFVFLVIVTALTLLHPILIMIRSRKLRNV